MNKALGFFWRNKEVGGFGYFYAQESRTLLGRSIFVYNKEDLAKQKDILIEIEVIASCSREKMLRKWRLYKLTNSKLFAPRLKDVPVRCQDAVLLKPLLKKHTVKVPIFEENTRQPYFDNMCLFRPLALLLQGNQLEEET